MPQGLLNLPLEIRLQIYQLVLGHGKIFVHVPTESDASCFLPPNSFIQNPGQRSGQLLRVCKVILSEARPLLYSNTTFHVMTHACAGGLPTRVTDGYIIAPHVKHLIWQLDCDNLTGYDPQDSQLDMSTIARWTSLEIRCRANLWQNSFMGELCDRETFVEGRAQLISYTRIFQSAMSTKIAPESIQLWEDRSQLGRGMVILKLHQNHLQTQLLSHTPDHLPIFAPC
ncbi:hypothetical protein B0A52_08704 [Exophiala mesophila]|uniref:DUF7730 domain-containing protein n=1 Tax=Exophiala mesophila TaxID=212818 RepID=A0A438MWR6_EXOME|nr:hypothetical protein B0A52_08704 [Exophiala mesophila]